MSTNMLFDKFDRTDVGLHLPHETYFSYINRSGRKWASIVREIMERWLEIYPEKDKKQIVAELRSKNENKFRGAFFELYIYQLLNKLGAIITVHPKLPNLLVKPDFLVKFGNDKFYLELTVIGKADTRLSEDKLIANFLEAINSAKEFLNSPYRLCVETKGKPNKAESTAKTVRELRKWLENLDKDKLNDSSTRREEITKTFTFENWSISFTVLSFYLQESSGNRIIAAKFDDISYHTVEGIRNALCKKYHYYRKLDKPLILAISITSFWQVDQFTISSVLFGKQGFKINIGNDHWEPYIENDGFWTKKDHAHERLSALLVIGELDPSSMIKRDLEIFHNPFTTYPVLDSPLNKLSHRIVSNSALEFIEGIPIPELLDLPKEWPRD
jgi:hypothetical protein